MTDRFPGMKLQTFKLTLYIRPEIPEEELEKVCEETDWVSLEDALRSMVADFIEDTPLLKDNRVRVELE